MSIADQLYLNLLKKRRETSPLQLPLPPQSDQWQDAQSFYRGSRQAGNLGYLHHEQEIQMIISALTLAASRHNFTPLQL